MTEEKLPLRIQVFTDDDDSTDLVNMPAKAYVVLGLTDDEVVFRTNVKDTPLLVYHLERLKREILSKSAQDPSTFISDLADDMRALQSAVEDLKVDLRMLKRSVDAS